MFKAFTIPAKEVDTVCNHRIITTDGTEGYCQTPAPDKRRCFRHNPGKISAAIKEELDASRLTELTEPRERVEVVKKDRRRLTELDTQVASSLVMLEELEKRYPLETIEPGEAIQMQRLRREHAELVHLRADLEIKMRKALNAEWLWEQVQGLFEKNIVDENTRQTVLEGVGKLLDELVKTNGVQA